MNTFFCKCCLASGPITTATAVLDSVDDNDVIILLMPRRIPHHDSHELLREVVNAVQDYAKGLNLLSTLLLQDKVSMLS